MKILNETKLIIDDYLIRKGWKKRIHRNKDLIYFKNRKLDTNYGFLTYSKRKKPINFSEFYENTKDFFKSNGYKISVKNNIINEVKKDTFFIVAGIQLFSEYFYRIVEEVPKGEYFIPQPVIRSKYMNLNGEGCLSSFVNISTGHCNSTIDDHVRHIDNWMNYISTIGLFMNDFNLILKEKYDSGLKGFWSDTQGVILQFNYGGLEVGDAGYIILKDNESEIISDIGFGLERLLWAINKEKFSDIIGPRPFSNELDLNFIDTIRTITLMSMSGISKENKDAYLQMSNYTTKLVKINPSIPIQLTKHYFDFWSRFINPKRSFHETCDFILLEINKQHNKEISKIFGINVSKEDIELPNDTFFERIILLNKMYNKLKR